MKSDPSEHPVMIAVADLVGRTGARSFEVRYSESDIETGVTIWLTIAHYKPPHPLIATADASPIAAAALLAERLLDGAQCVRCDQPVAFIVPGSDEQAIIDTASRAGINLCVYRLIGDRIVAGC